MVITSQCICIIYIFKYYKVCITILTFILNLSSSFNCLLFLKWKKFPAGSDGSSWSSKLFSKKQSCFFLLSAFMMMILVLETFPEKLLFQGLSNQTLPSSSLQESEKSMPLINPTSVNPNTLTANKRSSHVQVTL